MAVKVIWGGEKLHWLKMLIPNAIDFGGCMAFRQPRLKRKSQGLRQHACHFSLYCVIKYIEDITWFADVNYISHTTCQRSLVTRPGYEVGYRFFSFLPCNVRLGHLCSVNQMYSLFSSCSTPQCILVSQASLLAIVSLVW